MTWLRTRCYCKHDTKWLKAWHRMIEDMTWLDWQHDITWPWLKNCLRHDLIGLNMVSSFRSMHGFKIIQNSNTCRETLKRACPFSDFLNFYKSKLRAKVYPLYTLYYIYTALAAICSNGAIQIIRDALRERGGEAKCHVLFEWPLLNPFD